jgi:hypothetical protein
MHLEFEEVGGITVVGVAGIVRTATALEVSLFAWRYLRDQGRNRAIVDLRQAVPMLRPRESARLVRWVLTLLNGVQLAFVADAFNSAGLARCLSRSAETVLVCDSITGALDRLRERELVAHGH